MNAKESIREVLSVGGNEFQQSSYASKAMLGATACGLAFEWGTGNEALLGIIGGNVYRHTHDALVTAAATGGISFAEQSVLGIATAVSIYNFPRIMEAIRSRMGERYEKNEAAIPSEEPIEVCLFPEANSDDISTERKREGVLGRFVTVFALGTSVAELIDNSKEKRSPVENVKRVFKDAGLIATGVIGIAAAAAGATNLGKSLGLEQEANVFVDVVTTPFTYVGLFGLKLLSDFRYRKNQRNIKGNGQG